MKIRRYPKLRAALLAGLLPAAAASAQCAAPAGWFPHAQTPPPDPTTAPASNCEFHQWAWQNFLWLTQPAGAGQLRFTTFPTAADLFDTADAPPAPADQLPRERTLLLKPRSIKTTGVTDLKEVLQAGTRGALIDRNGHAVYYASNVNATFFEFVRTNKLYRFAGYSAASPTLNFPVGALELKSSWKVVPEGQAAAGFFTTRAEINRLVCRDGGADCKGKDILLDQSQSQAVTVALVGLHVVGVVQDHPEFIWATFEHKDNAPDLPAGMATTAADPVDARDWTFYRARTAAAECNLPDNDPANPTMTLVDPAKQTLTPVIDVFRQFAFGGGDQENRDNIRALNAGVAQQLAAAGDVFANYRLTGGVWLLPNALQPNLDPNKLRPSTRGSVNLANPTMETFTQAQNCFDCHNTARTFAGGRFLPPKNLNLSHLLINNLVQDAEAAMLKLK